MTAVSLTGRASMERQLDFERERILNLIGSRVRRKDIEVANTLAEELYNLEIKFALRRQVEKLKRHNRLVFQIFVMTLPVMVASVIFLMLGLQAFLYLMLVPAALVFMISFIVANGLLIRRFERDVARIIDAYETKKQDFTHRLIERFISYRSADEKQISVLLAAIKSELRCRPAL